MEDISNFEYEEEKLIHHIITNNKNDTNILKPFVLSGVTFDKELIKEDLLHKIKSQTLWKKPTKKIETDYLYLLLKQKIITLEGLELEKQKSF